MNIPSAIKRSPIVLIRTFAVIEVIVAALYFLGTSLDTYKYELYTLLPFSKLVSYQTLKIFFLPLAQLAITIYAFLRWYYESYTIRTNLISHEWGVFFKKDLTIPLDPSIAVTFVSGPLGKLLHYGSIHLQHNSSPTSFMLKDISRPQNMLKLIERAMKHPQAKSSHTKTFNKKLSLSELLAQEENERLEFKSSLRFDEKTGTVNRDLEKSIMKTIAALLNSHGGYVVIGVNDARAPMGLERDYPFLQRPDADGFENHFTQVFNSMIGPGFRHLVNVTFHNADNHDVCIIESIPSARPVYLKVDNNEHFYIRTGNTTTLLKLSEIELYGRSRWPRRASNA